MNTSVDERAGAALEEIGEEMAGRGVGRPMKEWVVVPYAHRAR